LKLKAATVRYDRSISACDASSNAFAMTRIEKAMGSPRFFRAAQ
jgi:hypothetical protein